MFETRSIQKDINILNGKIERIFTVADEIIFREAKLNEWNRKCYKSLALLQTTFTQLLEAISNIGVHLREIRHLEEMVQWLFSMFSFTDFLLILGRQWENEKHGVEFDQNQSRFATDQTGEWSVESEHREKAFQIKWKYIIYLYTIQ